MKEEDHRKLQCTEEAEKIVEKGHLRLYLSKLERLRWRLSKPILYSESSLKEVLGQIFDYLPEGRKKKISGLSKEEFIEMYLKRENMNDLLNDIDKYS